MQFLLDLFFFFGKIWGWPPAWSPRKVVVRGAAEEENNIISRIETLRNDDRKETKENI